MAENTDDPVNVINSCLGSYFFENRLAGTIAIGLGSVGDNIHLMVVTNHFINKSRSERDSEIMDALQILDKNRSVAKNVSLLLTFTDDEYARNKKKLHDVSRSFDTSNIRVYNYKDVPITISVLADSLSYGKFTKGKQYKIHGMKEWETRIGRPASVSDRTVSYTLQDDSGKYLEVESGYCANPIYARSGPR